MDGGEIIQWLGCFGTPIFFVFGLERKAGLGTGHEVPGASVIRKFCYLFG